MEFKLIATTGRVSGQAVEIRASKFFIGRHSNCQLRPDIAGLAGIHALIEERENRLYLRDFGAEGGTGLNDRVLHARETEVFDGDLIQVGPMVLTLSIQPKGAASHRALAQIPDGWPFPEGSNTGDLSTPAAAAPPRPRAVPAPTSTPTPTPALQPASARVVPFVAPVPSRPERVAASAAATMAPAVAHAPAATSPSSLKLQPIPTRAHGRRAIDCRMVDDVMVVSLVSPDLNEEETVSPVRYELRGLLEEEKVASKMVIDMGNTRYLSSRAVGVILAHYQGLERVGSSMRVCGVSKEIKPVLDQMRLSMLIDIYPSVEEAVRDSWD